ncbi:DEAD/DEAH box helicase [Telmatocola sphagniphila]|uniref:DNA 3'-5' helicase n=1 Tax=Telmatocola sphagniphila TaxID=1123043 RepID=A0A8E6ETL4_9BACT|nr:UvrD-helicase domain-containing protein [Telmatocola sphagniphila]QVL30250.1 DEAD/DEAH box helicase [Telmatocola sphagniphila]
MEFRIADTFSNSLAKLTGEEQKAVKTTAFDLQLNPSNPGMSFHKLDRAKDKNFWSVRVNKDIRVIVHKTTGSLLLCYVDHHDKAYDWASRRKLETHPKTGAAQLVEIRETVQEIRIPSYVQEPKSKAKSSKKSLFDQLPDEELLGFGVPQEWLADVKSATEDNYLAVADHLPAEAAEALLEIATGGKPRISKPTPATANPFEHPDALRRFRVMGNVAELERALDYPWEKWTVFLHPEQRELVEKNNSGPARVTGSAGTGKTIVALHRAAHLARTNPTSRVLLATFSNALAHALQTKLRRLLGNEPRLGDRIDVYSLEALGLRLHELHLGKAKLASRSEVVELMKRASQEADKHKFNMQFLLSEWDQVVDARQVNSWEAYRDVTRLGRKTRLNEAQRQLLWSIFQKVIEALSRQKLTTSAGIFTRLADAIAKVPNKPFDFAVIDEAQDLTESQIRFFAALAGNKPNGLFFAGDSGQRIFQLPFSWQKLGVDIRGRSKNLRINYRTSHQIRSQADRLLEVEVRDVDGNVEQRNDTISVFNGPPPAIKTAADEKEEIKIVGSWLSELIATGIQPHECGVFVRSPEQIDRAKNAVQHAKLTVKILDENVETVAGQVSICTMHLAKGLEFRAVAVMACDDEVIPLQSRIEAVGEDSDLKEVYETERQLLYVACTRARDSLLITGVDPASEYLDDMKQ